MITSWWIALFIANRWHYDRLPYMPTINPAWMPYATWQSMPVYADNRIIIITLIAPERKENVY